METFVFEDWNCPGMVYCGTQADMDQLWADGGYPARVNPCRILADGRVNCGEEGIVEVRRCG